jgi:NADPH-dependent 2,4-dienoyl-CoA reductase/sulfur reductase-like enzyme
MTESEHFETVIIGGGQAGLSAGYHLAKRDQAFVILEASERVGDCWRSRFDSLRLYSPAKYDGLPGWRFPGDPWSFPRKDEVADYLETYAERFDLRVRTGVRVDRLSKENGRFVVSSGERRFEAHGAVAQLGGHPTVLPGKVHAEIPVPDRRPAGSGGHASAVVPRQSGADGEEPARPQDAAGGAVPRRTAPTSQDGRAARRASNAPTPGSRGCATASRCWRTGGRSTWRT